jgi:multiple sugar transport system permease protein
MTISTTGQLASLGNPDVSPSLRGRGIRPRFPRMSSTLVAYLFCLPAIVLFLVFGLYTLGYGLVLSFATWNGFSPNWVWVGLQNYADLLWASPIYAPPVQQAAGNTVWVVIGVPLLTIAISFPLAILMNSISRFAGLIRSVYFIPYVTSGIAVFYAWNYILEPNGAINLLLKGLGLGSLSQPQGFLGNPATALPTLIVVMVWGAVPVAMILYLSGLQTIDPGLLEAAQLDGAGWWRTSISVSWPLLLPITSVIVLLNMRDALQGFQTFLLMTNGGPSGHTNVLGLQAYSLAFQSHLGPTLGLASALGWILFVLAAVLAVVSARVLRSRT